ncbi:MAG TPA: hypothetical protein DDW94_09490 [Deltaproteobacteria bacterium]|nr:MAG: hypothetical protein A2Z79_07475 [Deltaproteobacteria bacterium GWA2_55_82]OGQ64756.1 MAG: hypothetical protein A3I81_00265 [Deltaproteobacteria bacterium RIFCSPLOWO2_02_FULL_55_12]OIJ72604.1 MAG: hypothetical protein A2V21_313295 [Deltaproteobacteria bacterium GWC2_55_46]HBG47204.1 hypothetical protein [Deltaproteobacteria bacterium]HCY11948.1 hypothetical protein [Deltaproteobacteria bacterium]
MNADPSKERNDLRSRFKAGGPVRLCKEEILELIVSYAAPRKDPVAASAQLLKRFRNLRGVMDAASDELKGAACLGDNAAIFIKLLKEAAGAYLKERALGRSVETDPAGLLDYLSLTLSGERVEKFLAVYLGLKKEVVAVEVLHEGTINQTVVYPRKAIERAFRHNAHGVIFVHNHPSGDPTPSGMDRQLAKVLDRAAAAVDLFVHDHLIIGRNSRFSAREHGWMMGYPLHHRAASP